MKLLWPSLFFLMAVSPIFAFDESDVVDIYEGEMSEALAGELYEECSSRFSSGAVVEGLTGVQAKEMTDQNLRDHQCPSPNTEAARLDDMYAATCSCPSQDSRLGDLRASEAAARMRKETAYRRAATQLGQNPAVRARQQELVARACDNCSTGDGETTVDSFSTCVHGQIGNELPGFSGGFMLSSEIRSAAEGRGLAHEDNSCDPNLGMCLRSSTRYLNDGISTESCRQILSSDGVASSGDIAEKLLETYNSGTLRPEGFTDTSGGSSLGRVGGIGLDFGPQISGPGGGSYVPAPPSAADAPPQRGANPRDSNKFPYLKIPDRPHRVPRDLWEAVDQQSQVARAEIYPSSSVSRAETMFTNVKQKARQYLETQLNVQRDQVCGATSPSRPSIRYNDWVKCRFRFETRLADFDNLEFEPAEESFDTMETLNAHMHHHQGSHQHDDNTITMGAGFMDLTTSHPDTVRQTLAHEIGHKVGRLLRVGGLPMAGKQRGEAQVSNSLTECLYSAAGPGANREIKTGNRVTQADQLNETFADWFGTEMMVEIIGDSQSSRTRQRYEDLEYSSCLGGSAEGHAAALEDSHMSQPRRANRVIGAHPSVRKAYGVGPTSDPAHCTSPSSW